MTGYREVIYLLLGSVSFVYFVSDGIRTEWQAVCVNLNRALYNLCDDQTFVTYVRVIMKRPMGLNIQAYAANDL